MNCCMPGEHDLFDELSEAVLECDYDKNVTNLYRAIEKEMWDSVATFLATGFWSAMHFSADTLSRESQTRTWVTRFDRNGKLRWSQLPLHAAIIFHAPRNIVKALIDIYPLSVRCTDDQRMLPLHLAFRVGANDRIMNLLLRSFPEAIAMEDRHGNFPYAINGNETRKDYNEAVLQIVKHITRSVSTSQQKSSKAKIKDIENAMEKQIRIVKTLEDDNNDLENELSEAKLELAKYKERCRMLEKMVAGKKSIYVPDATTNNDFGVASRKKFQMLDSLEPKDEATTLYQSTSSSLMTSVDLNSIRLDEEPVTTWNAVKRSSTTDTDKALISNPKEKVKSSNTSFFLRESAERILGIDSKQKETRLDRETTSRCKDRRKHLFNESQYSEDEKPYII